MGDTLFTSSLVPARAGGARARALPLSIGAHAAAVAALLAVPLVAGPAAPPVRHGALPGPVVITVPPPPVEPPTTPVRIVSARPRAARTAVAPAPAATAERLVPLQDIVTLPAPGSAEPCSGCALVTRSVAPGPVGAADPGTGAREGPAGGGPAPLVVGGNVHPPRKLRHVDPVYPELARLAGVQGTVLIECLIAADGRVEEARVLSGAPLLDAAALAAVRQWRYRPTLLNGVAVPVVMTVTVRFRLR